MGEGGDQLREKRQRKKISGLSDLEYMARYGTQARGKDGQPVTRTITRGKDTGMTESVSGAASFRSRYGDKTTPEYYMARGNTFLNPVGTGDDKAQNRAINQAKRKARGAQKEKAEADRIAAEEAEIRQIQAETKEFERVARESVRFGSTPTAARVARQKMQARRRGGRAPGRAIQRQDTLG